MALREEFCNKCWSKHYISSDTENKPLIETEECVLCQYLHDDSDDVIEMMVMHMDKVCMSKFPKLVRILWNRIKNSGV